MSGENPPALKRFDHALRATQGAPFTIGLAPISPEALLEIDAERPAQLALKRRLLAESPDQIFAAEPASTPAQAEAAALIERALGAAPRAPAPPDAPPLLAAALQCQEDLLLMGRDAPEAPFRLVAGALCFPSTWALGEKFGKPMAAIHDPVPGFGAGSRNAAVIDRVFASLRPNAPVERFGWSIYEDAALPHPLVKPRGAAATESEQARARGKAILADPHLRIERQTLTRLPASDAILFTVRIHIERIEDWADRPDGAERARSLATALAAFSPEAARFKGLTLARPALLERLHALAAAR